MLLLNHFDQLCTDICYEFDSLILKNISDESIDGIMKIYSESSKQIFIAFDKQIAYKPRTQKILQEHTVLKLSDSNCELYGESWNKENDK